jgi:hypothetical protein
MGKYSLLVTLGVATAISVLSLQAEKTSLDTNEQQAQRQGKLIARQIARSGYNSVLSQARIESGDEKTVGDIVSDVGTLTGKYEGGEYEAWLKKISPTAYKAVSVGRFEVNGEPMTYRIGDGYGNNTMVKVPEVNQPSVLNVSFEQSHAGYCSAIYLERVLPDTKPKNQPDPEMVFPPGHDRNDATTSFEKTIQPGTKLNFILAVDKGCDYEGKTSVNYPEAYDHVQRSFQQDVSELNKMKEAPYGMVEETTVESSPGWRVSFEDQRVFSETQMWDIKENGYPVGGTNWNSENETYGGNDWDKNAEGLRDLKDYGDIPDYSDQVFQVGLSRPKDPA